MNGNESIQQLSKRVTIKHEYSGNFDEYIVYQGTILLFNIKFNKKTKQYEFYPTPTGIHEFAKNGIYNKDIQDFSSIYNITKRQYQIELIVFIFKEVINNAEIDMETKNEFEIYTAKNDDGAIFSFGYNKKTNKYGIKRFEQLRFLYKSLEIPFDIKPENFKDIYDFIKAEYNWQIVRDTVESMHDFIPDYYNFAR